MTTSTQWPSWCGCSPCTGRSNTWIGGSTSRRVETSQPQAAEHRAARHLAPDQDQVAFWVGLTLAGVGSPQARELLEEARAANPRWAGYLRRFAEGGRIPNDPAFLDALLPPNP